jgi:DNA-binding transcriptional LysR family regulator
LGLIYAVSIELRHLRYFVAVANELHFGRAAEQIGIAQPALSQQIKRLEQMLSTSLLRRTKRSVMLTDAGRLFLDAALLTLRQADNAESIGRRAGRGELGKIAVGYVASASFSGLLPKVLGSFRAGNPLVEVNVVEMNGVKQLEELAEERLDIGFLRRPIPFPRGLDAVTLHTESLVLALPTKHALARRRSVLTKMLKDETFLVPEIRPGISFHEHTMAVGRQGDFAPRIKLHGRDLVGIATMVALDGGIALVTDSLRCLKMPGVTFCKISDFRERANLSAVFREPETSPTVRALISMLKKR